MIKKRLHAAGRAIIHALCALSIAMPGPVYAQEDLLVNLEESAARLRASAERLKPILDRSQFDPEALLDSTEFDATKIVDFVTDEIGPEIYAGVLRGPVGTLVSGSGNALDQALLAATLLRDAGYEAVIRRGTLDSDTADQLIDRMFSSKRQAASPWIESPGSIDDADAVLRAARRQAWIAAAEAKATTIGKAVSAAGIEFDNERSIAALRTDASDYFWVEYRDGPASNWVSVHPALGAMPEVEVEESFSEGIPGDLAHQVTIEVIVDQRLGGKTVQGNMFDPIRLLGPELAELSLQITLLPDQLINRTAPLDPGKIAEETSFIYPIINGGMPAGAKALSLRGFLIPMDAMGFGAADYFNTASEKGAQAIDAIAGLGSRDATNETQIAIAALRLRVTFRAPDGTERIQEREWFSEPRDIGSIAPENPGYRRNLVAGLSRSHQFSFATGTINGAFFLDPFLDNLELLQPAIAVAKSIDPDNCETLDCLLGLGLDEVPATRPLDALFLGFDEIDRHDSADTVRYRHVPGLYIQSQPLLPQAASNRTSDVRLDIVSNAKRSYERKEGTVSSHSFNQIRGGVWETQIETDVFGRLGATSQEPALPSINLEIVSLQNIESLLPGSSVARGIKRDLDDGYLVFVNSADDLAESQDEVRWWRVDPHTAESLGMTHFGGAVTVEEAMLLFAGLAILQVANAATTAACMVQSSNDPGPAACFACTNVLSLSAAIATAAIRTIGAETLDSQGYFAEELENIVNWCLE